MKLHSVKIENFRSYKDEIQVTFDNFTAFVGRNDIGKSTVLEALDVFFNGGKGIIKLDKDDINKQGNEDISITVCFEDLPDTIVIDAANQTTLKDEYLLNTNRQLEVIKKYPKAGRPRVFVKANHPSGENCCNLLLKKNAELRTIDQENAIKCDNQTTTQ